MVKPNSLPQTKIHDKLSITFHCLTSLISFTTFITLHVTSTPHYVLKRDELGRLHTPRQWSKLPPLHVYNDRYLKLCFEWSTTISAVVIIYINDYMNTNTVIYFAITTRSAYLDILQHVHGTGLGQIQFCYKVLELHTCRYGLNFGMTCTSTPPIYRLYRRQVNL